MSETLHEAVARIMDRQSFAKELAQTIVAAENFQRECFWCHKPFGMHSHIDEACPVFDSDGLTVEFSMWHAFQEIYGSCEMVNEAGTPFTCGNPGTYRKLSGAILCDDCEAKS